jgi:hypothetical protein
VFLQNYQAPAIFYNSGVFSKNVMFALAWAVAHRCGGELHMAAKVLTIVDQNSP